MSKSDKKAPETKAYTAPPPGTIPDTPILGLYGEPVQNTPEMMNKYTRDLADPARRTLKETYDLQLGRGANSANTNGTINSIGFQDFKQNSLDKDLAEGNADIESTARLQAIETINGILTQDFENKYNRANQVLGENQNLNNYNLGAYNAYEGARSNRVNEAQQKYRDRNWLMKIFS